MGSVEQLEDRIITKFGNTLIDGQGIVTDKIHCHGITADQLTTKKNKGDK